MSMLMQYFVCDEGQICAWASAVREQDAAAQQRIASGMARAMTLKNLSDTDVRLLACRAPGYADHSATRRRATVDDLQGRHVLEFKRSLIRAIGGLELTDAVVDDWIDRAGALTGDPLHRAKYLTFHAARLLQDLCQAAKREELGFYCCYFG
jgi:hypothetical protein